MYLKSIGRMNGSVKDLYNRPISHYSFSLLSIGAAMFIAYLSIIESGAEPSAENMMYIWVLPGVLLAAGFTADYIRQVSFLAFLKNWPTRHPLQMT